MPPINEPWIVLPHTTHYDDCGCKSARLRQERDDWRRRFDAACAVLRLPDSTNDGGPGDLAEAIRDLVHNYETLLRDLRPQSYTQLLLPLTYEKETTKMSNTKMTYTIKQAQEFQGFGAFGESYLWLLELKAKEGMSSHMAEARINLIDLDQRFAAWLYLETPELIQEALDELTVFINGLIELKSRIGELQLEEEKE